MDFIHAREYLNSGDVVVVNSDTQCNVMLTDDLNFSTYKRGGRFTYYGGFFERFPVRIAAPHAGNWNITIDVGEGYRANIRYNIGIDRA